MDDHFIWSALAGFLGSVGAVLGLYMYFYLSPKFGYEIEEISHLQKSGHPMVSGAAHYALTTHSLHYGDNHHGHGNGHGHGHSGEEHKKDTAANHKRKSTTPVNGQHVAVDDAARRHRAAHLRAQVYGAAHDR
uniref:Uncharacterized protein n=1 Tax=Phaeomonas parva TaxID=124430 RepID=A0A6U4CGW6_9STRA|mmetsp:Transcript_13883/g.41245  ORF Transcript_13883/g.41245 Transcript_13883/m.41245 type:complete len:133 (+) Transcript_13883:18-416(+)